MFCDAVFLSEGEKKNCYVKVDQFLVPLLQWTRVNVMSSPTHPYSVQSQRAHGSDCGVTHGFALGGQTRREAELCNERLRSPMAVGGERRMKTKSTWLDTAVHVNREDLRRSPASQGCPYTWLFSSDLVPRNSQEHCALTRDVLAIAGYLHSV